MAWDVGQCGEVCVCKLVVGVCGKSTEQASS